MSLLPELLVNFELAEASEAHGHELSNGSDSIVHLRLVQPRFLAASPKWGCANAPAEVFVISVTTEKLSTWVLGP